MDYIKQYEKSIQSPISQELPLYHPKGDPHKSPLANSKFSDKSSHQPSTFPEESPQETRAPENSLVYNTSKSSYYDLKSRTSAELRKMGDLNSQIAGNTHGGVLPFKVRIQEVELSKDRDRSLRERRQFASSDNHGANQNSEIISGKVNMYDYQSAMDGQSDFKSLTSGITFKPYKDLSLITQEG